MTGALVVLAAVPATALALWRLLRHQTPHPERPTVDWDELRAMWPAGEGIE